MPLCPSCKTEQTRRKEGCCPQCGTEVSIHKGLWYRTDLGNPNEALIKHLEKLQSERQTLKRGFRVIYTIPRKGERFRVEMGTAARLLEITDGDLELAKETITILFKDDEFSWKNHTSMMTLQSDWPMALAIARGRLEEKSKREATEQAYVEELLNDPPLY